MTDPHADAAPVPRGSRPHAVTAVALLFLVTGATGLVYHAGDFKAPFPWEPDVWWAGGVRLLAALIGACLWRGQRWARWGAVLWLGYHAALSMQHTAVELLVHAVLLAVVACGLFRPRSSAYFRGA